jgi:hypothetical protein
MMLVDNLIHSDLHPGNILVRLSRPEGGLLGAVYRLLDGVKDAPSVGTQQIRLLKHTHTHTYIYIYRDIYRPTYIPLPSFRPAKIRLKIRLKINF